MHTDNLAYACMLGSGEELMETSTCLCFMTDSGTTRELANACLL